MQQVTNSAWYANNETIKYPLDSEASGYSNTGEDLPTTLITDLKIVTTEQKDYYLSGVTCTPYLLSVVLASKDGLEAALTLPQPVKPLTHYAMTSFRDSVQALIAVGHCQNYGQWQFSDPAQSRIAPGCVAYMRPWPVTSIRFEGTGLTGDVQLEGGGDLSLTVEEVYLGNTREDGASNYEGPVRAIVFRSTSDDPKRYLADCAVRPTNGDCGFVTSLGGAVPDEDGNINISVVNHSPEIYAAAYVQSESYAAENTPSCKGEQLQCAGVNLAVSDVVQERKPMEFGQCGTDLCEEPEPVYTLDDGLYPLNAAAMYIRDDGASGEENVETILFTEKTGTVIEAVFSVKANSKCGVSLDIEKGLWFQWDGETVSLGEESHLFLGEDTAVLRLEYHDGILAGTIRSGSTSVSLTSAAEGVGTPGILILNSLCAEWSVT